MGKRLKLYLGEEVHHPRMVIMLALATFLLVGLALGWSLGKEGKEKHDHSHVSADHLRGVHGSE